jgi:hypothetical protein
MSRPRVIGRAVAASNIGGRPLRVESPDPSQQDSDTGIFYEPPYSIGEAAVGLTVMAIVSLLFG